MTTDFANRVVLVTGSARGIGRAVAEAFAALGASVVVHYNSHEAEAQKTFMSLPGDGHLLLKADLSQADQARRLVDDIVDLKGRIDVVVNNTGMYVDHPIASCAYDEWLDSWRKTIDTNLFSAANVSYCAARYMMKQGGGRIVNVSSRGAFRGEPTAPAYGASKAAMNSMSQSLALALAPHNIFVGVVAPGFVETERVAHKLSAEIRNQSPLGRVALPEEVARTVVFLAQPGTEFLTGCIVDVNGASYLRS